MVLNVTIDHPKTAEYTFFSSAHEMFSRIGPMPGHKSNFNKLKNRNFIKHFFSETKIKHNFPKYVKHS